MKKSKSVKKPVKKATKASKKKASKSKSIAICSSASFYKNVVEVEEALKKMGYKVLIPYTAEEMKKSGNFSVEAVKTWYENPEDYKKKTFLTKNHFKKIVKSDSILVLNYEKNGKPGYIGGAVLAEMAIALHFNKPIFILNPIQEDVSYKEELLGALPIILGGKLEAIKERF